MASASELLSYTGNANLGLGSNPSTPGIQADQLKGMASELHSAFRDVMLLDHENQVNLFKQKIADRDSLREMLEKGQIPAGEIDQQYRPYYDAAEKDVTTKFDSIKGINDTKGIEEYMRSVKNLQDVTKHAQERTLMTKAMEVDKAKNYQLPREVASYDEFIGKEKSKPFWDRMEPYQPDFSFTTKPLFDSVKINTSTIPATEKNPYDTTVSAFDYNGTSKAIQDLYYQNNEAAEDMRRLLNTIQQLPPEEKVKKLNLLNQQIERYNKEFGLQPTVPSTFIGAMPLGQAAPQSANDNYAGAIKFDPKTGVIQDNPADFAAKYVLANQGAFKSSTTKPNDKMFTYNLGKEKNKIGWFNAETSRLNHNLRQAQVDKQDAQQQQFAQSWNNFLPKMTVVDPNNPFNAGLDTDNPYKIPVKDIPQGYLYNQGLDGKGNPIMSIPFGAKVTKDEKGNITDIQTDNAYFVPKFFIPKGTVLNGKQVGKDQYLSNDDVAKFAAQAGYGNIQDFIQAMNKSGMIDFDLEGQNGTATRGSSFISQMAIGNKMTTQKTDTNPYSNVPLFEQPPETTSEEPQ